MGSLIHVLAGAYILVLGSGFAHACLDGSFCTTDAGKHGFCINSACVDHIPPEVRDHLHFKIVVKYPESQLKKHGLTENMYIRGTGLGFNWMTGARMTKVITDTWETEVTYTSSQDGFRCESCSDKTPLTNNKLEYRIYLDNGLEMQGANFAVKLPISSVSSYFHEAPKITVYPWFLHENGTVSNFTLWSRQIGGDRNIAVYMPPSFHENTYKTYPVIVAFDISYDLAQSIRYVFDDTIKTGFSQEYIIVGFGDYNSTRTDLLTPSAGDQWACVQGTMENRCAGCIPENATYTEYEHLMKTRCGKIERQGGQGEETLDFLTMDVLRRARGHCDGRIRLDRDSVGIMGYSLGGLMACHAAWTRPHVFGMAACQSSSFWWPKKINLDRADTAGFDFINETLKTPVLWEMRPWQTIYIDVGGNENEDQPPYNMGRAALDATKAMVEGTTNGYERFKLNENLWVHVFPGDKHNLVQWAMRAWKAIHVLLPAPGAPSMQALSRGHSPVATGSVGIPFWGK